MIWKFLIKSILQPQCFQIFFTNKPVIDYKTSKKANGKKFQKLFKTLLKQGVFIPPSQFEVVFLSDAHTENDFKQNIRCISYCIKVGEKLKYLVGARGSKLSVTQTNWVISEFKKSKS